LHHSNELSNALHTLAVEFKDDVSDFQTALGCRTIFLDTSNLHPSLLAKVQRFSALAFNFENTYTEVAAGSLMRQQLVREWLKSLRSRYDCQQEKVCCKSHIDPISGNELAMTAQIYGACTGSQCQHWTSAI
jgi:hypothetical protein